MASASEILKAYLHCARTPAEDAVERIRTQLKKQYGAAEVELTVSVEPDLISGYVLQVGDRMFDNSGRHQLDQMMAGKPSLATLKTRVEDYKPAQTSEEGGVVIASADGIVQVEGMDRAVYGEIVTFENGAKGMVESVEPGRLGIMLFDGAESVGVGTLVTRSGKRAGIPVGEGFLGRVIDPLGEPIDGKGPVEAEGYNPIEKQAPGILERQSVDTPLHTGILAIDSIYTPIKNVKYVIENFRVDQKTDYDKLILEITTNGSIHPKDALKEAARILIHHFALFSDEKITIDAPETGESDEFDEEVLHMRQLLKTKLVDMELSVRALNCLKSAEVETLGELVQFNKNDLLKFRNFGKKSLTELDEFLASMNLSFGMDISKYKLDKE